MASYSAIPLQQLNSSAGHEDVSEAHDGLDLGPKHQSNVSTQRFPSGSLNNSSDTIPFGKQAMTRHVGYGRLAVVWWQEILSFLFAVVAFVAIAIILAKYNGQEQPDWKYSLNLSTLVAILSTLLRASMVVVVEEIIGQLKWIWYKTSRPLRHLSYFDQAARSPWGSILLPFRIRRLNLALLGAVVVLLSLAVGPFTQQAIKNVSCEKPVVRISGTSDSPQAITQIPIAHQVFSTAATRYGAGLFSIDSDVKGAIINGMADPSGNLSAVSAVCGSGNCTFTEYSSSGMCQSCSDVTSKVNEITWKSDLKGSSILSNLTLPNGLSIGNGDSNGPKIWLNISTDQSLEWAKISDPVMLAGLPASIYNFTLLQITDSNCTISVNISSSDVHTTRYSYDCPQHGKNFTSYWRSYGIQATTCALFPCVKNYWSNVTNGVLDERVVDKMPLLPDLNEEATAFYDQTGFNTPCIIDGQQYDLSNVSKVPSQHLNFNTTLVNGKNITVPSECYYSMNGIWMRALSLFMSNTLSGACSFPTTNGPPNNLDPHYRSKVRCATDFDSQSATADAWWLQELYNGGNGTFRSVQGSINAITTAITNKVRVFGKDWDGSQSFAVGTSSRTTICTKVEWLWLIFPALLLALTLFLLIIIALRTLFGHGNVPMWKSSILPLIFANTGFFHARSGDLRDIDDAAEQTVVSLLQKGDKWEFARPDGATSSGFDANDPVRHEHRHHHDWPGPSTSAFL